MLAIYQKRLKFVDVAANVRRLLGSSGGAVRRDALVAGDADGPMGGDGDQEAFVTYKKAKRQGAGQKRRGGAPKLSGDKVRRDAQALNGPNLRAGQRMALK